MRRDKLNFLHIPFGMLVAVVMLAMMICSCRSVEYVPVVEHKTDTLLCYSSIRDSIYMHDSIHVTERGDTVRIERWHTKYVEKVTHDTIYRSSRDSIPVPYEVTKYVEKKLTKTQTGLIVIGLLSLIALVAFLAVKLRRLLPW